VEQIYRMSISAVHCQSDVSFSEYPTLIFKDDVNCVANTISQKSLSKLQGHTNGVTSVAFSGLSKIGLRKL